MKPDKFVKRARELAAPFRVSSGKNFRLKDYNPADTLKFESKDKGRAKEALAQGVEALSALQAHFAAGVSHILSGGVLEASADLGANAFQTFFYILLPNLGTALLAGGMLAFALSFDEVIVTTFTAGQQSTLPIWMLQELIRPRQRPVTNVVAIVVFAATVIPILVAYWLTKDGGETAGGGK